MTRDPFPEQSKGSKRMLPAHVAEQALHEMHLGARHTYAKMAAECRAGRLCESDLEAWLRSVAWQSERLRAYLEATKPFGAEHGEMLSDEDMHELLAGAPSPSRTSSWTSNPAREQSPRGSPECEHMAAQRSDLASSRSEHMSSFRNLSVVSVSEIGDGLASVPPTLLNATAGLKLCH